MHGSSPGMKPYVAAQNAAAEAGMPVQNMGRIGATGSATHAAAAAGRQAMPPGPGARLPMALPPRVHASPGISSSATDAESTESRSSKRKNGTPNRNGSVRT